jgi:hypothetical protein
VPRNTCHWSPGGTKTFRNKSGMLIGDIGSNLQNPSDDICRIYVPDEGKVFIQVDCAGAEALIVAWECDDARFRQLFKYGIKPHTFVAMNLFAPEWKKEQPYDVKHLCSLPIPELAIHPEWKALAKVIKNYHERYFIGKKTCHSFNYCKTAASFRFDVLKESEGKVALTLAQSELFEGIYHFLFPEIKRWQKKTEEIIKTTRTLRNLFGYPMHFGGHITDKIIREGVAWVPQSTVGIIGMNGFRDMQRFIELNNKPWDVLNNKHDSVLVQAPENAWEEPARLLSEMMSVKLVSTNGEEFQMKTEVSVGKNWGKWDAEDNPDGMKEVNL